MKRLLTTLALGAGVLALGKRLRDLREVPAELRTPILYPPIVVTPWTLRLLRRIEREPSQVVAGVTMAERYAGDVRLFVYTPANPTGGGLLWIHGGGRVLGAAAADHEQVSTFAAEVGCVVVSVDYRLAPEAPYPAAIDDVYAGLCWLLDTADDLGIDRDRVAVGGSSAGGGLAAELAQRARDNYVSLALQLLVYPMLDDRTVSSDGVVGKFIWTPMSNRYSWAAYLGHPAGAPESRPYAVAARREDLTGLAPAWIGVGDLDLFLDEDRDYARRLTAAGVACEYVEVPGMYHAADGYRSDTPSMVAFNTAKVDALRAAIG